MVEVVPDQFGEILNTDGVHHRRRFMVEMFAFASGRKGIGMKEPSRTFPKTGMIQKSHHRPVVVVGQLRQGINKARDGLRPFP